MYIYIMKRTQIYIDEEMYAILEKESRMKNVCVSEVIRETIQERLNKNTDGILKAVKEISGLWRKRRINVEKYIRRLNRYG